MNQDSILTLTPSSTQDQAQRGQEPDFRLETFAHGVAFGLPIKVAMLQAGFDSPSSTLGFMLLKDPRVHLIIQEDRQWLQEKLQQSKEALASQFDADREFAYAEANPSAAVSATMGKAKVLGFMDVGAANRAPSKITIEWGPESTETIHERAELIPMEDVNE